MTSPAPLLAESARRVLADSGITAGLDAAEASAAVADPAELRADLAALDHERDRTLEKLSAAVARARDLRDRTREAAQLAKGRHLEAESARNVAAARFDARRAALLARIRELESDR